MDSIKAEIAQVCARLIAEEGLDYGAAKLRAVRQLGLPSRTSLPGNDEVESALEEYLRLFCADTQPHELLCLRRLALQWMERLADFSPQLSGAVWRGTATRWSDVHIQLYCADPKSIHWFLLNAGIPYDSVGGDAHHGGECEVLSIQERCAAFASYVGVHLSVRDALDRRGSLTVDAKGRTSQGSLDGLRRLLQGDGNG